MMLVCCQCMALGRHDRAAAHSPLTIVGGDLVCADHLPTGPAPKLVVTTQPGTADALVQILRKAIGRRPR